MQYLRIDLFQYNGHFVSTVDTEYALMRFQLLMI